MRCDNIIEQLETLAPLSYACDWDNPGLLAGRSKKEVKKIMVALDVTDEVVKQAVAQEADMLVTHHPLIFSPLRQVNDLDFISRRIVDLLQHDISYYAMHTNFDCVPGGMADLAADFIGLQEGQVLEVMGETADGRVYGIGKKGILESPMTLEALAEKVKQAFHLPFVMVYGKEKIQEPVSKVAISPGSGKRELTVAVKSGVQVLITGDIGHHEGIDAVAGGLVVMDAGHYGLEHIFVDFMASYIKEHVDSGLCVVKAAPEFPTAVL